MSWRRTIPPLTGDERTEPERLRAENAALPAQGQAAGPRPGGRRRWRTIVASLLIVLGCVLAPLSVVAVWTRNQVTSTDRYVAHGGPAGQGPGHPAGHRRPGHRPGAHPP